MQENQNNPFKLWGSYIGLFLLIIFSLISLNAAGHIYPKCWEDYHSNPFKHTICDFSNLSNDEGVINALFDLPYRFFANLFNLDTAGMGAIGTSFYYIILSMIVGFILGWQVHRLILNNKR